MKYSFWGCGLVFITLARSASCLAEVFLGDTTVQGLSLPQLQQEFFGGIPFAEPPVGELRFQPPVAKLNLNVTSFNASQYGPSCSQFVTGTSSILSANLTVSEDCLSVNVFRPAGINSTSGLPVMVWVYGGEYAFGSSSQYNASALLAGSMRRGTPIVYVSLNYRLGPLGFPQGAEAESEESLNLGLKDVIAALEWVQTNIKAFGGDRDKVTIFGQSAGSMLISQLLLNSTFDLARAVILQSGSAATASIFNATRGEPNWKLFTSAVPECDGVSPNNTFSCLRSASFDTLVSAGNAAYAASRVEFPFLPVIDKADGLIPDLPSSLYARGHFAKLPFIAGDVLDEGTLFTSTSVNATAEIQEQLIVNISPPIVSPTEQKRVVDGILELYPDIPALGSPYGTGNETFGVSSEFKRAASIYGDRNFHSLRRDWIQTASSAGVKSYGYLFTDPQTTYPAMYGVPHASDVLYVYGAPPNGANSEVLSSTMIDYWVSFVTSLDPNDGNGNASRPHWAQYTPDSQMLIQLNWENSTMIADTYREGPIAYLNDNAVALHH
ncbi:hypothetical protein M0805_009756 [Coniferiporia weirii]|nr:hypothetical protein M0805_009756 [Coniferiporia weirii]